MERKLKAAKDVDVNLKAPGQRFKSGGKSLTVSFGDMPWLKGKKKVCDVCGKPWSASIRVTWSKENGKRCVHDTAMGRMNESDKAASRIQGRLKPNEVAVRGDDGMIRIYG